MSRSKCLARAIDDVNDAFEETQILLSALVLSVVSDPCYLSMKPESVRHAIFDHEIGMISNLQEVCYTVPVPHNMLGRVQYLDDAASIFVLGFQVTQIKAYGEDFLTQPSLLKTPWFTRYSARARFQPTAIITDANFPPQLRVLVQDRVRDWGHSPDSRVLCFCSGYLSRPSLVADDLLSWSRERKGDIDWPRAPFGMFKFDAADCRLNTASACLRFFITEMWLHGPESEELYSGDFEDKLRFASSSSTEDLWDMFRFHLFESMEHKGRHVLLIANLDQCLDGADWLIDRISLMLSRSECQFGFIITFHSGHPLERSLEQWPIVRLDESQDPPDGFDSLRNALDAIGPPLQNWARSILDVAAFAARPLTTWELADMLGCPRRNLFIDLHRRFSGELVIRHNKLTTAESLSQARLRDILTGTVNGNPAWYATSAFEAHARLTNVCAQYLLSHTPRLAPMPDIGETLLAVCISPGEPSFLEYAAQYWAFHAREATGSPGIGDTDAQRITETCVDLVSEPSRLRMLSQRLWLGSDPLSRLGYMSVSPLPMIASLGLVAVLKQLLEKMDKSRDEHDTLVGEALVAAANSGFQEAVAVLITAWAKPSPRTLAESISYAAHGGHCSILRTLMHAASSTPGVILDMSVLRRAAFLGLADVVQDLLDNYDVDLEDTDEEAASPLYLAIRGDKTEVAKLLISRKPSATRTKSADCTPLWAACSLSCAGDDMLKLLVEGGAPLEARNDDNETAISQACRRGRHSAVKFLLQHGASPKTQVGAEWSPLAVASYHGCRKCLGHLLTLGQVDPDSSGRQGTALMTAAISLGGEICEQLLSAGADPNLVTETSVVAPLGMAADWNNLSMAKLLLAPTEKTNIEAENGPDGDTALIISLWASQPAFAKLLLDRGADPNHVNKDGVSPLMLAAQKGDADIAGLLIQKGAKLEQTGTSHSFAALHLAAANQKSQPVLELLLEEGANPNICVPGQRTPLMIAALGGRLHAVQSLVQKGAHLETETERELSDARKTTDTALLLAVRHENTDVADALLDAGADINHVPAGCFSALQTALIHDDEAMLKLLLEYQPHLNPQDMPMSHDNHDGESQGAEEHDSAQGDNGDSQPNKDSDNKDKKKKKRKDDEEDFRSIPLLSMFSERTPLSMIRMLVNRGASVNPVNLESVHPLVRAAYVDNDEIVAYLIRRGADIHTCRRKDGTALHVASQFSCLQIVRTLVDHGADVSSPGTESWHGTPLQRACFGMTSRVPSSSPFSETARTEVLRFLLTSGADANTLAGKCGTALNTACWRCPDDVISLLLEHGARVVDDNPQAQPTNPGSGDTPKPPPLLCDSLGRTAVHFACLHSAARLGLIARQAPGSDIVATARDKMGLSALHWAVIGAKVDVVSDILARRHSVDVNAADVDGWTPLMWAARGTTRSFLLRPECQHMTNEEFAEAVERKSAETAQALLEIVRILLSAGADRRRKGKCYAEEWTAKDVASYYGLGGEVADWMDPDGEKEGGLGEKALHETAAAAAQSEEAKDAKDAEQTKKTEADWRGCDACFLDVYGCYHHCDVCLDFDLCFKCYGHHELIHPQHRFTLDGVAPGSPLDAGATGTTAEGDIEDTKAMEVTGDPENGDIQDGG
ncbi:ankyrin repeat-containing domain protein [Cercophora newfieldiana]|uniref:Ankyrin repeat-containing domain protein n=1 Tax=Cercophora newfieldiana TaxID=92897 RepID=A0AA39XZ09_9PEZI|nr:ankyrin repeat-containing domain protein [Cercophora newfieldiana]